MEPMDKVFDWCVDPLEFLAPRLGMTSKELNVWLFVIVMPGMVVILPHLCMYLWQQLRRARRVGWAHIDSSMRKSRWFG
jgi:hypothetical protein